AGKQFTSGTAITRIVRYDLTIIDTKLRQVRIRFFNLSATLFQHFLLGSSVSRCSLSAYVQSQTHPFEGRVEVQDEQFVVAYQSNNTAFSATASFASHAAAGDHLTRAIAQ